ncbi:unnamed protein product [Amoebophrya sp. A25]|nr:unnamed protein product [Amoebophrya sp. A25]|eukprot:GSA25T00001823001.1
MFVQSAVGNNVFRLRTPHTQPATKKPPKPRPMRPRTDGEKMGAAPYEFGKPETAKEVKQRKKAAARVQNTADYTRDPSTGRWMATGRKHGLYDEERIFRDRVRFGGIGGFHLSGAEARARNLAHQKRLLEQEEQLIADANRKAVGREKSMARLLNNGEEGDSDAEGIEGRFYTKAEEEEIWRRLKRRERREQAESLRERRVQEEVRGRFPMGDGSMEMGRMQGPPWTDVRCVRLHLYPPAPSQRAEEINEHMEKTSPLVYEVEPEWAYDARNHRWILEIDGKMDPRCRRLLLEDDWYRAANELNFDTDALPDAVVAQVEHARRLGGELRQRGLERMVARRRRG